MSRLKNILVVVILLVALSFAVLGVTKISQPVVVAEDITLEEIKECNTIYWNETEEIYGTCTDYQNITVCYDEPYNTSCSIQTSQFNYTCKTGTNITEKNKEVCSDKEMQITIDMLQESKKYSLNYGDWGKCSYEPGSQGVIIICDSRYDGNNDGICTSGESCIAFIVSKDGVSRTMRNSRDEFVEADESFFLPKLEVRVIE